MKQLEKVVIIDKKKFFIFYSMVFLFVLTATFGTLNIFFIKNDAFAGINCGVEILFLVYFSIVGWFSENHYYRHIHVFRKVIDLGDGRKLKNKNIIFYVPSIFLIFIIIINFGNAFSFSYQMLNFFEGRDKIFSELAVLLVHLLLIPSLVNLFEEMIKKRNAFFLRRENPFILQAESLWDIFENYKFDKNYIRVHFEEYDLNSRNNIFFVDNRSYSEKVKKEIEKLNIEILNIYKDLWEDFLKLLSEIRGESGAIRKREVKNKDLQKFLFHVNIWFDFFGLNK